MALLKRDMHELRCCGILWARKEVFEEDPCTRSVERISFMKRVLYIMNCEREARARLTSVMLGIYMHGCEV